MFTLKFHLLDHLVTYLKQFGNMDLLNAAPFEHFDLSIKMAYKTTSKRSVTRMDETVARMDLTMKQIHSGPVYSRLEEHIDYSLQRMVSYIVGDRESVSLHNSVESYEHVTLESHPTSHDRSYDYSESYFPYSSQKI